MTTATKGWVESSGWLQTASGRRFNVLAPNPADVDAFDIGWSLAHLNRYAGSCGGYSVAQHVVIASRIVPPEHALAALLHDAPEYVVTDLPRPIKQAMRRETGDPSWFDLLEDSVARVIYERFNVPYPYPQCVRDADMILLATEARDIVGRLHPDWHHQEANGYAVLPERIIPLSPPGAFLLFADRWRELTGESIHGRWRGDRLPGRAS